MKLSVPAHRAAIARQRAQCCAQRSAVRAKRERVRTALRGELSRPGTLAGAFAIGSLVGGPSQAKDECELEKRLTEIEATLSERDTDPPRENDNASDHNMADVAFTLVTSIATRFAASFLLEKVGNLRAEDVE